MGNCSSTGIQDLEDFPPNADGIAHHSPVGEPHDENAPGGEGGISSEIGLALPPGGVERSAVKLDIDLLLTCIQIEVAPSATGHDRYLAVERQAVKDLVEAEEFQIGPAAGGELADQVHEVGAVGHALR